MGRKNSTPDWIAPLTQLSNAIVGVVSNAAPAVATIHALNAEGPSSGSGFLFNGDGHVITNHHVVAGAGESVRVQFSGETFRESRVIGTDPLTDLAVIAVPGQVPSHLPLRSSGPRLGEICLALGSPLGDYEESVSIGIVSGLARTIPTERGRPLERVIQTDAAINPGNSGGPLIDAAGQVIGVNTCVDRRAVGIGFAVPADVVSWVAAQILQYGDVRRGSLGVAVATRMEEVQGRLRRVPVVTRTPATRECALQANDIIVGFNGYEVRDRTDLYFLLTRETIGKQLGVRVLRKGKLIECLSTIGEYEPPATVHLS